MYTSQTPALGLNKRESKEHTSPLEVPRIQVYPSRSTQYPLRRCRVCTSLTMVPHSQGNDDDYTTCSHAHHTQARHTVAQPQRRWEAGHV
jgi:hypothetical protein